jgi:hypothetical protein
LLKQIYDLISLVGLNAEPHHYTKRAGVNVSHELDLVIPF